MIHGSVSSEITNVLFQFRLPRHSPVAAATADAPLLSWNMAASSTSTLSPRLNATANGSTKCAIFGWKAG